MFHQSKTPASLAKRKYYAPSPPRMIQSAQPGGPRVKNAGLAAKS